MLFHFNSGKIESRNLKRFATCAEMARKTILMKTLKSAINSYFLLCVVLITACQPVNPYLGKNVEDLVVALGESDAHHRELAARALQELGPNAYDAVPALVERLFDSDKNVRVAARDALVAIGPKAVEPLLSAWDTSIEQEDNSGHSSEISNNIGQGIDNLGVDTIPELSRIFYKYAPGSSERLNIILILTRMIREKGKDAIGAAPVLVNALGDRDILGTIQSIASDGLLFLGSNAVPALVTGLSDRHPKIRYYSAVTLGRIGPDAIDAGPALVVLLNDQYSNIRAAARMSLEKIGYPYQYSPSNSQKLADLMIALRDPNVEVRIATAEALGNMGADAEPAHNALLVAAQTDNDPNVREAADNAIKKIRAALK